MERKSKELGLKTISPIVSPFKAEVKANNTNDKLSSKLKDTSFIKSSSLLTKNPPKITKEFNNQLISDIDSSDLELELIDEFDKSS